MGVVSKQPPADAASSFYVPPSPEDTFYEDMPVAEFMWRSIGPRLAIEKQQMDQYANVLMTKHNAQTLGDLKFKVTKEVRLTTKN